MSSSPLLTALLLLVAAIAPGATGQAPPTPMPPATIKDLAWLEGTWVSTAGSRSVEERWTPAAGGAMFAISRTLDGSRLLEFEYLRIVERDGGLVYVAQPNGSPATDFRLARIEGSSATFENPAHDFPKVIKYSARPDGTVEASIGGGAGQRTRSWVFVRQ